MKVVIVDTNILFAAMRAKESPIRSILTRSKRRFVAPNFLVSEIFKHKEKLLRYSKASEDEVNEFLMKSLQKISFVNEEMISTGGFIEAYKLCKDVDEKDTPFVALTLELDGELWTRDKALIQGLTKKGFTAFFDEGGE